MVTQPRPPARGVAAALILLAGLLYTTLGHRVEARRSRRFTADSVFYLSTARNLAADNGIVRDIAIEDRERLPAREAYPPPGYPLLVAPLILCGMESEAAALAVPFGAHLLTVGLFALLGWRRGGLVGCGVATALGATFWPLIHASALALTESPFILLVVGMLLAAQEALRAGGAGRVRYGWFLLAGALGGLSVVVRTAGAVGMVVPAAAVVAAAWPSGEGRRRRPVVAGALLAVIAFAAVATPLFVRNWRLSGTLGGIALPLSRMPLGHNVGTALGAVSLDMLPFAWLRLLFFHWPFWRYGDALPGGALLLVVGLLVGGAVRRERDVAPLLPALWAGGYLVLVCVLRSRVWFAPLGSRMMLPLCAVMLYALAEQGARAAARGLRAGRWGIAALVLCALVVTGQLESLGRVVRVVPRARPAPWPGQDAAAWLDAHTEPGEAVVAHRSCWLYWHLPSRRYVAVVWRGNPPVGHALERGDLGRLRERFGARYLVLFKPEALRRTEFFGTAAAAAENVHGLRCLAAAREAWERVQGEGGDRPEDCGPYLAQVAAERGSEEARLVQEFPDALIFAMAER